MSVWKGGKNLLSYDEVRLVILRRYVRFTIITFET
jgi:hypothetical protein